MYMTRGWSAGELGDLDVIVHEDRLHLFHLNLPSHDVVSHLVSDDGMRWERLPNALHTGEPGEPDDDQIWTMHTFRWKGRFYMLYTCLAQAEDGRIQRTGLATSDDLITWKKVPNNPVAAPDPRWYEADLSQSGRADWRDPFPWIEGDTIHALVCAHEKNGPFNRRGCVAHLTSTDAEHWAVKAPFYAPRVSTDFEVPCIFMLNGRYYLTGHICAPQMDVWRVADRLEGPWRRPIDDLLLPADNHAFHAVVWRGETLLFNWVSGRNWDGSGAAIRILPTPKVATADADGSLVLRPFESGWKAVAFEEWGAPSLVEVIGPVFRGKWRTNGDALVGESRPGMGVQFLAGEWRDFELELTASCEDAPELGIVFRSDRDADRCMRVSCRQGRDQVELAAVLQRANYNAVGRGFESVQSNLMRFTPGGEFRLRLSAHGPYLEVSINGVVRLSAVRMDQRAGRIGLFVEDGRASFGNLRMRELRAPDLRLPLGPISLGQ
jgi:beta-fructofuranosidase